jgi:hypothetical protein
VATYEYQDGGLGRLVGPAHDAESFGQVLADPAIADFEVTTLINEPYHLVGEAIGELYSDRRRDDLTLLYFTGHGVKDENGRLHLAMRNTRTDRLPFTSISAELIDGAAEQCRSRQKVIILDCCYSGAFPAGSFAKSDSAVHALNRFQGRGRVVLTASDSMQYAFDGSRLIGDGGPQSVFTRYLVEGLRTGAADLDQDGDVSLDELYSYVYERVVDEVPQQRPKKQDDVEGRIYIARNVNWRLPSHIRGGLRSPVAAERATAVNSLGHLAEVCNEHVRRTAYEELEKLLHDDSRMVAAAAARVLQDPSASDIVAPFGRSDVATNWHANLPATSVTTSRGPAAEEVADEPTATDPATRPVGTTPRRRAVALPFVAPPRLVGPGDRSTPTRDDHSRPKKPNA